MRPHCVASAHPTIPREAFGHVLHGIGSREKYVHGACAADLLWCAASALVERCPAVADNLQYHGGSFGGGIGALALPWDPRIRRTFLDVPSFGNHPLRVQLPCVGSGAAVRRHYLAHPEVMNVLQYFDAATAARHTRIPVCVAAARFDPAVPPPGQFAVANALAGETDLFIRAAAHHAWRGQGEEDARLNRRLVTWFAV